MSIFEGKTLEPEILRLEIRRNEEIIRRVAEEGSKGRVEEEEEKESEGIAGRGMMGLCNIEGE